MLHKKAISFFFPERPAAKAIEAAVGSWNISNTWNDCADSLIDSKYQIMFDLITHSLMPMKFNRSNISRKWEHLKPMPAAAICWNQK